MIVLWLMKLIEFSSSCVLTLTRLHLSRDTRAEKFSQMLFSLSLTSNTQKNKN